MAGLQGFGRQDGGVQAEALQLLERLEPDRLIRVAQHLHEHGTAAAPKRGSPRARDRRRLNAVWRTRTMCGSVPAPAVLPLPGASPCSRTSPTYAPKAS
jgi:hypothetical protein